MRKWECVWGEGEDLETEWGCESTQLSGNPRLHTVFQSKSIDQAGLWQIIPAALHMTQSAWRIAFWWAIGLLVYQPNHPLMTASTRSLHLSKCKAKERSWNQLSQSYLLSKECLYNHNSHSSLLISPAISWNGRTSPELVWRLSSRTRVFHLTVPVFPLRTATIYLQVKHNGCEVQFKPLLAVRGLMSTVNGYWMPPHQAEPHLRLQGRYTPITRERQSQRTPDMLLKAGAWIYSPEANRPRRAVSRG